MKRSLLVAALSLAFASAAWAAGPSDQSVIIAQQQQQTALLQSINTKLDAQDQTRATDHKAAIARNLPVARSTGVAQLTLTIYNTEHGKEDLSQTMTVLVSSMSTTPVFTGTTVPYRAAATDQLDKDGKPMPPTMKTLDIGTFVNITPLDIENDRAVLSLSIQQSRLISLVTVETNGLTIDLPSTKNLGQTQGLNLKVGQSVEFQGLDGHIVVSLTRIDAPMAIASSPVPSAR